MKASNTGPEATVADRGRYPPVMPLPRHIRSGRNAGPAHSDANRRPVRPKPVATSSQMRRTPFDRQASPTRAKSTGSATRMPDAPCTKGSITTAASVAAWVSMAPIILVAQSSVA